MKKAPLTYAARTDICETGTEPGCSTGSLHFLGRNTTSESGVYQPADKAPVVSVANNGLNGANKCALDPDFQSKICRVTDYSMGSGFNQGAAGGNFWAADTTAFVVFGFGGAPVLFSFSNDYHMNSTVSDIRGIVPGGDATHFASHGITFASTDPNSIYEVDYGRVDATGNPIVLLNKVGLVRAGAPSSWSLTRATVFNFEEASGNCLPPDFFPNWIGTMTVSSDDQEFQISFSDHGQNGVRDATHPYGATLLVAFNVGKGCRVVNTYGTDGYGPMTIAGDWGDTGTALDGSGAPLGVSEGNPLPDTMYLHDSGPMPNGTFSGFTGSAILACTAGTCSCTHNNQPALCENYYWETGTRNIRPVQYPGHAAKGYLYSYKGKHYVSIDYQNPTGPFVPLLTMKVPTDQHGTYNNGDNQDDQPVFLVASNVCGQAPGMVGSQPCDPAYTASLYDEIFAAENQAAHPGTAQHCDYGNGRTACTYRFAHTFNTGTNWNFYTQNAEGNVSPSGRFFLFPSDWNLTLGCTNGTSSGCLDNITASSGGYCSINWSSAPCQRGDVFVVDLMSARPPK